MKVKFLPSDEKVITLLDGQGNACLTVTNIEEEDETFARSMKEHSVASHNQPSRVLGVMWDHITDTFRFDFAHLESYKLYANL